MDYKYIEQLLERYWQGETTLQEEAILKAFFSQPCQTDIPESLRRYQPLFLCESQQEAPLGDDFDARILDMIDEEAPEAKTVSIKSRLMPLFRAAAIVAIVLTLGNAAQAPWEWGWEDPKDAYAKFHEQAADSVNMLGTIQAENLPDSAKVNTTDNPAFNNIE
ncbi:MAG: pyruvate ferredoxin oxidoreductase [Prevotella sp.]|nr:pyruvate ferredoxin oxidoreductase [Prevotella sp.]